MSKNIMLLGWGEGKGWGRGGLILSTLIGASCSIHKAKGHQTTNPNHLNSDISESFLLVFVFPSLSPLSLSLSPFISKGKEYHTCGHLCE